MTKSDFDSEVVEIVIAQNMTRCQAGLPVIEAPNYNSYDFNDMQTQNKIDELERNQQKRDFWDSVCPPGQSYDALAGAGCP